MKRTFTILLAALFATVVLAKGTAQQARTILDKAAAAVTGNGGATAFFSMTGKYGNASGTIAVKGNKFCAQTAQAIIWNDGKTQWTYNRGAEEVNVSHADEGGQTLNPYAFVSVYKQGYTMTSKTVGAKYEVHLTAQNKSRTIQEMYITVNKKYQPTQIKVRTAKGWSTISVSNFRKKSLPDSAFRFRSADYPRAEVIDLR
ncbi:MAG: outer-membrane lipoprotein carrier protein LolA [Prevotella sp.]|nr:outer-membrane lipoprotein carrier protein LolA [Prevotella sp.]